jgi:hypothetical protein
MAVFLEYESHDPGTVTAEIIVPPRSTAVPCSSAETAPTPRDQHIQDIAKHGRMAWQKSRGYNRRAKVEASIGRYKRVTGDSYDLERTRPRPRKSPSRSRP